MPLQQPITKHIAILFCSRQGWRQQKPHFSKEGEENLTIHKNFWGSRKKVGKEKNN
jgi:hypothetical protein